MPLWSRCSQDSHGHGEYHLITVYNRNCIYIYIYPVMMIRTVMIMMKYEKNSDDKNNMIRIYDNDNTIYIYVYPSMMIRIVIMTITMIM